MAVLKSGRTSGPYQGEGYEGDHTLSHCNDFLVCGEEPGKSCSSKEDGQSQQQPKANTILE